MAWPGAIEVRRKLQINQKKFSSLLQTDGIDALAKRYSPHPGPLRAKRGGGGFFSTIVSNGH